MDSVINNFWPMLAAIGSFGSLLVTVFLTIHSFRSKKLETILTQMKLGFEMVDEKFNKVDQRFDQIDKKFDRIDVQLNEIKTNIHKLDIRLVTIETENRMIQWPMVVNEDIVPKRRPGRPRRVLTHKEN